MSKASKPEIINLDDEEFFEFLEALNRIIGIDEELPDEIELRWRNESRIVFKFENNNWYKIIEE